MNFEQKKAATLALTRDVASYWTKLVGDSLHELVTAIDNEDVIGMAVAAGKVAHIGTQLDGYWWQGHVQFAAGNRAAVQATSDALKQLSADIDCTVDEWAERSNNIRAAADATEDQN